MESKLKTWQEYGLAIVIVALGVLVWNPANFWMPDMVHLAVLGIILAAFALYATLVFREQAGDEREETHKMFSGRLAFLAGSLILVLGIVFEALAGKVDGWLVAALAGMVLVKALALSYTDRNR